MEMVASAKDLEKEIRRLGKLVGQSFNFPAALWAIDTLIKEYEKLTGKTFEYEKEDKTNGTEK